MTRLRQRVAERLKGAQNTSALLTTFNEIDMSSLMEMRSTYKVSWGGAVTSVECWRGGAGRKGLEYEGLPKPCVEEGKHPCVSLSSTG